MIEVTSQLPDEIVKLAIEARRKKDELYQLSFTYPVIDDDDDYDLEEKFGISFEEYIARAKTLRKEYRTQERKCSSMEHDALVLIESKKVSNDVAVSYLRYQPKKIGLKTLAALFRERIARTS